MREISVSEESFGDMLERVFGKGIREAHAGKDRPLLPGDLPLPGVASDYDPFASLDKE